MMAALTDGTDPLGAPDAREVEVEEHKVDSSGCVGEEVLE
jgi:hypothetical protein